MNLSEIQAKTASLKAQIEQLQKEAAEQIKPLLQQFITENPRVTGIRWTQYTPYFNDGDTCTFGMNEPRFQFEGQETGGDYDDGFFDPPYNWDAGWADDYREACQDITLHAKCSAFAKQLQELEEEMEILFGDHVQVTVTAEGVETESYHHD